MDVLDRENCQGEQRKQSYRLRSNIFLGSKLGSRCVDAHAAQHNEICGLPVLNPRGGAIARVAFRCGDCRLFLGRHSFRNCPGVLYRRIGPGGEPAPLVAFRRIGVHPLSWAQQQFHDGHAAMAMPIDQRKEGMLVVLGVVLAAYVE